MPALVIQFLVPLITHSSPSRTALVRIAPASEPASGSERQNAGDLLHRDLEHQRPGPGAAELLRERQREHVLLAEQPADVPRVLVRPVDLGGARRDPLRGDLPDRVAEVLVPLREVVDVRGHRRGSVFATSRAMSRYPLVRAWMSRNSQ